MEEGTPEEEEEKTYNDLVKFVTAGDLSCYDGEDFREKGLEDSPTKFKPKTPVKSTTSSGRKKQVLADSPGIGDFKKMLEFKSPLISEDKDEQGENEDDSSFKLQLSKAFSLSEQFRKKTSEANQESDKKEK